MGGINQLMARIMYGAGLRLMELVRLRVKDIDFSNAYLVVRDGKGGGDRTTFLGESIVGDLKEHLVKVRQFYDQDVLEGHVNESNLQKAYVWRKTKQVLTSQQLLIH